MKKAILLSIFAAALFASCAGSGEKNQSENDSVVVVEEAVAVIDSANLVVVELSEVAQLKNAEKPVIIDFNATWCMPCKQFAPHFESVAQKTGDKAVFVSVDVDKWQDVANEFGAQAIPMVVIVKPNGEKVSHVGYMSEAEFEEFVAKNI
ncbi:MAG: thioredoxin family protein [Muribaculaceae bacterium]|nr:thioredoxin family protein [Muribaculaceae bacterium]